MSRPVVNPGVVSWAGEHLLLYLRPPSGAEDTTLFSFYRTQFSPAGPGHAALVLSDAGTAGRGAAPLRMIVTDNPEMATWARQNLARSPGHPFRDPSLPIVSGQFIGTGMVGRERIETIRTDRHEIVLRWADLEPPLYFEGPQGTLGTDYDVFSLLFPAATASVTLDGEAARGQPYPREIWRPSTGRDLSSALIAICEVLIERQGM